MANIEIDGQQLEAEPGSMIIEAADEAGISIPRFCYHKRLSVAANCRMCLVDVANLPKPVPACATPVSEGMVVQTHSKRALDAQKSVMEFLLINHPLDCPICDQGGECELQDVAVGYGNDVSRFTEGKRVVDDKDIGPLITTDMTRCIHCTRCVRFGTEIAGMREMGETGRGEHMRIGTFIEKSIDSEVSGNIIDLCPVGALTAKPSRYKARAWEMEQTTSIAPHDCLGSNVAIHSRRNEVIRVVPHENDDINESWISDRDRFSYAALSHERLTQPMIRKEGVLTVTDWQTALNTVVDGITKITQQNGPESLSALLSPSATTEEMYLLQKLMRHLGSSNIDSRLKRQDFSADSQDALFPSIERKVVDLEHMEATLLVGSNLRKEQPIAAVHLRKSTFSGKVMAINPEAFDYNFKTQVNTVVSADQMLSELAGVAKALTELELVDATPEISALDLTPSESQIRIAKTLAEASSPAIIFGQYACNHSDYSKLAAMGQAIAEMIDGSFGCFSDGANSAGAHLVGAIPYRNAKQDATEGKTVAEMLTGDSKAFIVQNIEPSSDINSSARAAFDNADFVVALDAFQDSEAMEFADVILPIAAFTETSGTFVNTSGDWQSFNAAVPAKGEARPAWKVYRVLGNLFEMEGFDYTSSNDVLEEVKTLLDGVEHRTGAWAIPKEITGKQTTVSTPIYQVDNLVRRSEPLQATMDGQLASKEAVA